MTHHPDKAREAADDALLAYLRLYGLDNAAQPAERRRIINCIIDAFLAASVPADEKIAEISAHIVDDYVGIQQPDDLRLEDAKTLLSAFARSQTLLYNAEREVDDLRCCVNSFERQNAALAAQLTATRNALEEERERCAKVADAQVASWEEGKSKLRPISIDDEAAGRAHDRFFNYIENAKSIAKAIRALPSPEVEP